MPGSYVPSKFQGAFLLYDFVWCEHKKYFCCYSGGAYINVLSSLLAAMSDRFKQTS